MGQVRPRRRFLKVSRFLTSKPGVQRRIGLLATWRISKDCMEAKKIKSSSWSSVPDISATMTYSGKIPVLGSDGYPYWKGRMEAFLISQSQDIWDATQSTTFVVLPVAERTTQDIVAQHEANAKASIINKLCVNSAPAELPYADHQQAVKLLYALDRKVWEIKVNSIIESAEYDTIGVEVLYKEQLATLGDDELCLVSSRFQRAYDNRMSKKRGERPKFSTVGHFIAECPNKNDYYKKDKSYSCDSDKYHSGKPNFDRHRSSKHSFSKRPFGKKNFWKAFKSYQKDNRKRDKAFFAEIGFCSSGSSSSSSSSSSSDEEITYRKDKKNDQGGPAGLCFVSTKSRCKNKDKRSSVCSLALEDNENKDDGSNSSSDDEDRGMEDVWIMDSGCSRHMTGHRKWFSSLNPMSREFELSLMGELQFFLGLQIKQGLEGTFVHQANYTRDILKKFNMGDSKPMTTPMSTNTALDADEDGETVYQKEVRGMIGSLLYLTATRPDIQFVICLCASPRTSHRQAVKRIFRLQVEGIDNALIKGEIESQWTGVIALLV
ncbi:LOW QUALITY PROTEIN: hypothetical protein U9M48_003706 [Paspalum notatum var. saurae]|uniref:Retrovirus-related Pol polyprotein from transposon TNT 1-94-like beta-barrel domain-containing protein n=1 Tax=Paspalum notatum var. saurae TaxID=547442 RepID=A0AAQ3PU14_PASNO